MRVIHVVAHPPFREGTGTACYYNARALQSLGCEVQVYAPRLPMPAQTVLEVPYRFLRSYLSIGNAYLTPGILALPRADIIHLHYPFLFGAELSALKSTFARIPLVITYHNDLTGVGIRRFVFWIYNRVNAPWILQRARKLIVTSYDYAATSIYATTIFAKRAHDVVEIHNGVDESSFHPNVPCETIYSKYRTSPSDFLILFVSSLDRSHARKGLDVLLDALADAKEPSFKLIVVGDGEMRSEYQEYAHKKGVHRQVYFVGRVSQDELPAYYAACDVVCIPSRPPEAFGLALAQGMSTGKPVIGSDIPGVRTLVGEGGLLIPPGDRQALAESIRRLREDPALRQQLGAAGRARILNHYTWHHVGERLLAMYHQVLEGT